MDKMTTCKKTVSKPGRAALCSFVFFVVLLNGLFASAGNAIPDPGISTAGSNLSGNMRSARSADISIKGKVKDEQGGSLPGASISVKGTTYGVITNEQGDFSLTVPSSDAVLVISFIGFRTQEIVIGNKTFFDIQLEASQSLSDVVVIGYGTQKKSDLTGAVGSVKAAELQERPAPSLNQMLSGRVSGVQVNTNSGRPGGRTNVRIRGFSSINSSNNPLYVIDGVMIPIGEQTQNMQAIDFINPNDIVSVEVLKDASATAIYGARGANGVILVSTKRGKAGDSRVTYDVDVSLPTLGPNFPKFLNAKEYLAVEDLAYKNMQKYDPKGWSEGKYAFRNPVNARTDPRVFDSSGNPLYDTKWIDVVTQHKISQNHQLGFTGGNDKRSYSVSLGYRDDQGMIQTSYLRRYAARFSFDDQIKSWLKVGGSLSYANQEENLVDFDYQVMRNIAEALPFLPPTYSDGVYANNRDYPNVEPNFSPLTYLKNRKYVLNTQNLLGSIFLNINVAKDLEFRTVLGTNVLTQGVNQFTSSTIAMSQRGTASASNRRESFWSLENYFTYNKRIGENHAFTALAGLSWQETNAFSMGASIQNFSSDFFEFNNLGAGSNSPGYSSGRSGFAFNSYFGRINYVLKDKYLFTVTGRADGSSKFGNNRKYSFFPSAAVAWKISQEAFLKNSDVISNLKLRGSVGETGNSEIPAYSSLSTLNSNYAAILNNQRVGGTGINRLANPDLKWEKTKQADIGVELSLLNNRVQVEADVYYRRTVDMLLDAPVARTSGYGTIRRNVGSMENKGLEISLNTVNIESRDFSWNTTFNISMNRNKVLKLATPSDIYGVGGVYFINPTNVIRQGEPVGSFLGLVRLGVWGENERDEAAKYTSYRAGHTVLPGDIKYQDLNGDHAITAADQQIIGNGSPNGWGSIMNRFRYKGFELMLDLQYSYGNDVFELSTGSSEDRVAIANSYKTVLNAWTPQNQNTMIPEIRDTRAGYVINEDTHWLKDGSFLRGRNVMLAYTLPSAVTEKLKLSRMRIYGSVQNFFLLTSKEVNGDPETVGTTFGSGAFAQGLTYHAYPKPTTFMLGLNLSL